MTICFVCLLGFDSRREEHELVKEWGNCKSFSQKWTRQVLFRFESHCTSQLNCLVTNSSLSVIYWQQTSTADMLDWAVEYIKDLQKEVKVYQKHINLFVNHVNLQPTCTFLKSEFMLLSQTLTDKGSKCTCSGEGKQVPNPTLWLALVQEVECKHGDVKQEDCKAN